MRFPVAALAAVLALLPLAARAEPPTGATIDGIRCDAAEGAVSHIHQHVTIYAHGKPVAIPGDVGRPATAQCLYWIHTHTPDGLIHEESPVIRSFTLGNLFDVWGEPLSPTRVASATVPRGALRVYVDGKRYAGNPRDIPMATHTDVTLEAGPPYRIPAPFTDWQGQ